MIEDQTIPNLWHEFGIGTDNLISEGIGTSAQLDGSAAGATWSTWDEAGSGSGAPWAAGTLTVGLSVLDMNPNNQRFLVRAARASDGVVMFRERLATGSGAFFGGWREVKVGGNRFMVALPKGIKGDPGPAGAKGDPGASADPAMVASRLQISVKS